MPERINDAASKEDGPKGYERSNRSTSSSLIYLSVAQMGARLFREQEVIRSIRIRETRNALVAQRKSTSLRSWVVRSSNLFEGASMIEIGMAGGAGRSGRRDAQSGTRNDPRCQNQVRLVASNGRNPVRIGVRGR